MHVDVIPPGKLTALTAAAMVVFLVLRMYCVA